MLSASGPIKKVGAFVWHTANTLSLIINGYRSKLTYPREGAPGASPSSAKIVTGNNDNVFK